MPTPVSLSAPDDGKLRSVYLSTVTRARNTLEGTALLRRWDTAAARRPRTATAHLRTLLAVHNVDDLVAMDLPWWTYRATDLVDGFLSGRGHQARVFEYGSGASTVWLARRSSSLDSVEHDAMWADRVRELLRTASAMRCTPTLHTPPVTASAHPRVPSGAPSTEGLDFYDYVHVVDEVGGPFDLVLVDGRARGAALLASLDLVADEGMLLLDDAQRPRYDDAVAQAEQRGWHVLRTRGATPCQPLPRETVLLSRRPFSHSTR